MNRHESIYIYVLIRVASLPGAIGMYALSLGVQHINDRLPNAVYALLSGLNASTVGIVALAAVQVSLMGFHSAKTVEVDLL